MSVAVVDGGINLDYLKRARRANPLDVERSFVVSGATKGPGEWPTGHGTSCAWAVGVAAPAAVLLDVAAITEKSDLEGEPPLMEAWVSDVLDGLVSLRDSLREASEQALVISNSWALVDPAWDFADEANGSYANDPEHLFTAFVRALENDGADVIFAAGNCGPEHPMNECKMGEKPICGSNSLEQVLTVGAVDVTGELLGYSSHGPGRLYANKPDLCGPSHFVGSKVRSVDSGTSIAAPAVAGVVAAIRQEWSPDRVSPARLRELMRQTARRPTGAGHRFDCGWGVVDAEALLARLPAASRQSR